jgi:2-polyprenyl-3-methyl-5-hydroxy-6-metoxy-1,4-benzoquinol methylase
LITSPPNVGKGVTQLNKKFLKRILDETGLSSFVFPRIRLAKKYLSGKGVEIGALATPLKLPRGADVEYIDIVTREESIRKFPELNPDDFVHVDYIADGFTLAGIPESRFDFLIVNHVLEHSPDPIGTLANWHRVLKPGGVLFCTGPAISDWFDKGRRVTTVEHMLEDYRVSRAGKSEELTIRNKEHYREWLQVSEPAILKRAPPSPIEIEQKASAMAQSGQEIHFHTFTDASVRDLFTRLSAEILKGLSILEIHYARKEIIVVAKK